ncbi:hypothetical protein BOTBODRAFT_69854 [Botryobasidium botryosum FD-172 SS1]|uniref:Uncharacterized protein n=1 Tax=Botryobasidium botryosum (strain FD-172 SS1) TaxID=930990 RepID=A0A067M9U6_BOTB1|nr:hypothetical protein BOTBODRAFT_69854 [Botryobasidium botryosum FD-172 SS1]
MQAVPPPPPSFFSEVVRRRTVPLYQHPHLHPVDLPAGTYVRDGSVTDGDDHEGTGGHIESAGEIGGLGWREVFSGEAKEALLKRRRVFSGESEHTLIRRRLDTEDGEDDLGEADTSGIEELAILEMSLVALLSKFEGVATLFRSQLPHKNEIWMRGIREVLDTKLEGKLDEVLKAVRDFENNGRSRTWAKTAGEQIWASRITMGLQLDSTRILPRVCQGCCTCTHDAP